MNKHISADGYEVEVGKKFWNNDLRVVEVTKMAVYGNSYGDSGCSQIWHRTTDGDFDTLTGSMQPYGRLARWFQGKDAEQYEPGTEYADVK